MVSSHTKAINKPKIFQDPQHTTKPVTIATAILSTFRSLFSRCFITLNACSPGGFCAFSLKKIKRLFEKEYGSRNQDETCHFGRHFFFRSYMRTSVRPTCFRGKFELAWSEDCSKNKKIRAKVDSRIYGRWRLLVMGS